MNRPPPVRRPKDFPNHSGRKFTISGPTLPGKQPISCQSVAPDSADKLPSSTLASKRNRRSSRRWCASNVPHDRNKSLWTRCRRHEFGGARARHRARGRHLASKSVHLVVNCASETSYGVQFRSPSHGGSSFAAPLNGPRHVDVRSSVRSVRRPGWSSRGASLELNQRAITNSQTRGWRVFRLSDPPAFLATAAARNWQTQPIRDRVPWRELRVRVPPRATTAQPYPMGHSPAIGSALIRALSIPNPALRCRFPSPCFGSSQRSCCNVI